VAAEQLGGDATQLQNPRKNKPEHGLDAGRARRAAARAVKESCGFTQRAWLTATIVVGLLAFTALFVFLRHRRTQRVIHRSAP
jgi:hypothetical protein